MALTYTALKRFTKALTTWVQGDATLLTLTGHTGSNIRIYVKQGNELLLRPSLVLDVVVTNPYISEVDNLFLTEVQAVAYADSRVAALDIAGAVIKLAEQNTTTLNDAAFDTDNIRTKHIKALGVMAQGESIFDPTSIRRTERSDVVAPERNVAVVPLMIVWGDTTP